MNRRVALFYNKATVHPQGIHTFKALYFVLTTIYQKLCSCMYAFFRCQGLKIVFWLICGRFVIQVSVIDFNSGRNDRQNNNDIRQQPSVTRIPSRRQPTRSKSDSKLNGRNRSPITLQQQQKSNGNYVVVEVDIDHFDDCCCHHHTQLL